MTSIDRGSPPGPSALEGLITRWKMKLGTLIYIRQRHDCPIRLS
jgi:hypothetical protein